MRYLNILEKHEPRSLHHELPIEWDCARGYKVFSGGKSYIDFTSGIFVANIGHGHPLVLSAILEQLEKPLLHTYAFANKPRAELVEKLIQITGMEKVYLCSTGSEAVEAAIRCMGGDPDYILTIRGAFHGNTFGAKSVLDWNIRYCDWPDEHAEFSTGLLFESYLGYNAQFHPKEWVQAWCNWAKKKDIPVCFDEVQAGFGRTGKMFGYEHYDVKPDLICVGKGITSSLPLSAVIGRADLLDAPDDLSSTHTGNPLCCAAALASIEIIEEEGLVEKAAKMEEFMNEVIADGWCKYPIRGHGAVWAIDLGDVNKANEIVDKAAEKGLLLVKTHRGTIKIGPPLIIPPSVFIDGLAILKEAMDDSKV